MESKILHLDLDAFFASCEEARNPSLKLKPLIIGADPKKGKGRGVVSTCNYKARKFGVSSAMPISIAYKKCPDAIFLQPDFSLYNNISKTIFSELSSLGFPFLTASIDEAYLDLSKLDFPSINAIIRNIKHNLFKNHKLTCSIGVGPNKTIAKIASEFNKPNGTYIVAQDSILNFLAPLKVEKIPGVGKKSAEILNKNNFFLISDLQKSSKSSLILIFGLNYGSWLWSKSRGYGSICLDEFSERKSLSLEHTFMTDLSNRKIINFKIKFLSNALFKKITKEKLKPKTITAKIRFSDYKTYTKQISFKSHSCQKETIERNAFLLFNSFLQIPKPVRLIGLKLSNFSSEFQQVLHL